MPEEGSRSDDCTNTLCVYSFVHTPRPSCPPIASSAPENIVALSLYVVSLSLPPSLAPSPFGTKAGAIDGRKQPPELRTLILDEKKKKKKKKKNKKKKKKEKVLQYLATKDCTLCPITNGPYGSEP
ncbi:hypothetical protein LX36DRAFT_14546 [Colletotrichum falcatum]|nr:hypothetical protein LX36DRAFT_14546 [Colletotrichum falcatum]